MILYTFEISHDGVDLEFKYEECRVAILGWLPHMTKNLNLPGTEIPRTLNNFVGPGKIQYRPGLPGRADYMVE